MAQTFEGSTGTMLIAGAIALCLVLVGGGTYLAVKSGASTAKPTPDAATVVSSRLSTQKLSLDQPTWQPNYSNLAAAIAALKMPSAGPTNLHHHMHLDISIEGQPVSVPTNIGLYGTAESPLHTHNDSGVLHVESSDTSFKPTLGQFFDIWGVYLGEDGIGGYRNEGDKKLTVYLNGLRYIGNPHELPMTEDHMEIYITYGTDAQKPATIPESYEFPTDL